LNGSGTFIPRPAVTPAASLFLFMNGLGQIFSHCCNKRSQCAIHENPWHGRYVLKLAQLFGI